MKAGLRNLLIIPGRQKPQTNQLTEEIKHAGGQEAEFEKQLIFN
jgi:hypothetical protein